MLESFYCRAGLMIGILIGSTTGQFNPIAFSVGQDSHVDVQHISNATVIPFSLEITNNKAVNLNAGVFTCTEAGLYKFQMYALTKSNTNVFLELYQNDVLVASLWGHTPNDYAAAGNAVVLPLEVGDVVKVMSRSQYDVSVYGTPNEVYTTFTGVQLGSLAMHSEGAKLSAFSVNLRQHQDVPAGTAVLYDTVLTDVNSAYNVTTGVYTVPTPGIYIFHFFSLAKQNQALWQELYHNNQFVCSIYGLTEQDWADAGNTVILHLKAGDEITIRAHSANSLYGSADQIYSTFSGAQLATDEDLNSNEETVIAFSVGLSHHATVTNSNKVIFDRIFIDLHHAYNQVTGEFIAPVSGLYEFNYHALGKQNGAIWLELFHNYRYVDSLYSHTPNHFATAGNAAVVELDVGDVVFVKAHNDQDLYGANNEIYCTFSGYLLYTRGQNPIVGK